MANISRHTRDAVPVPQDLQEASSAIGHLAAQQRLVQQAHLKTQQKILKLQEELAATLAPQQLEIDQLTAGLFAYAQANRKQLTDDGKTKTVHLAHGTISWRLTPRSVTVTGVTDVLAELKKRHLNRFIRETPSIDREAMLDDPEAAQKVPGITIGQKEELVIKPNDSDGAYTRNIKGHNFKYVLSQ